MEKTGKTSSTLYSCARSRQSEPRLLETKKIRVCIRVCFWSKSIRAHVISVKEILRHLWGSWGLSERGCPAKTNRNTIEFRGRWLRLQRILLPRDHLQIQGGQNKPPASAPPQLLLLVQPLPRHPLELHILDRISQLCPTRFHILNNRALQHLWTSIFSGSRIKAISSLHTQCRRGLRRVQCILVHNLFFNFTSLSPLEALTLYLNP